MEIITQFLELMQALLMVKVAMLLVAGIGVAIAGFATRKRWLLALGLMIAFGQFAWPWLANKNYEGQIEARRAQVRDLPKIALPADYPRRLILDGDITPNPPGWFLAAGYVDEVDVGGKRLVAADGAADCAAAARVLFDPDIRTQPGSFKGNPYTRIEQCTRVEGAPAADGDAIILRVDGRTTLFDRENARRHGAPSAIQLSLRRGGTEALVHFDEIPILASPASATQLLPESYRNPCQRFAHLQIVANLLDAAKQPSRAEELMRRGAVRRSENDACLSSMAPERR